MDKPAGEVRTVAELMCREVIGVGPKTSIHETIRLMVEKGIRHVPVMEGRKVIAMVSDRDIRVQISGGTDAGERMRYLQSTPIMQRASKPVSTIAPDASPQEAAALFVDRRIGCLPVVDEEDNVVGIVTQTDLLKWLAHLAL